MNTRRILTLIRARAMAILCFWPPDNIIPRSPTKVSNPWGRSDVTNLNALASLRASKTWSSPTWTPSGAPYRTLSLIVPEKRTGSWITRSMDKYETMFAMERDFSAKMTPTNLRYCPDGASQPGHVQVFNSERVQGNGAGFWPVETQEQVT